MSSDPIEYELRALDINFEKLETKIKALGGKLLQQQSFRRYVFDSIPKVRGKWLRLRTDGVHTTLCLKIITNDTVDGTLEWEVEVSDFDKTATILTKAGFEAKGYQENTRTEYKLLGARVALDRWPLIPPYLEIEANDEETVLNCAHTLGYNKHDLTGDNTQKIYTKYGFNLDEIKELKFEEGIVK